MKLARCRAPNCEFDESVAQADDGFDLITGVAELSRSRPTWSPPIAFR